MTQAEQKTERKTGNREYTEGKKETWILQERKQRPSIRMNEAVMQRWGLIQTRCLLPRSASAWLYYARLQRLGRSGRH